MSIDNGKFEVLMALMVSGQCCQDMTYRLVLRTDWFSQKEYKLLEETAGNSNWMSLTVIY